MSAPRILGIILIIAGVILFIVGLNASDSVADRMSSFFTGTYTDSTVWYMIGGAVLTLGGLAMALLSGRVVRT